jgi:hypothetical protein
MIWAGEDGASRRDLLWLFEEPALFSGLYALRTTFFIENNQ